MDKRKVAERLLTKANAALVYLLGRKAQYEAMGRTLPAYRQAKIDEAAEEVALMAELVHELRSDAQVVRIR